MERIRRRVILFALLLPGAAAAQPQGRGQGQGPQGQGQGQGQAQIGGQQRQAQPVVAFSTAEQARITAWLSLNAATLQPLPPGIARNLARGKPLPPGIARRAPPQALLSQLVARPGYEILVVGTAVVLAQAGNLLVHDLVREAGRGR